MQCDSPSRIVGLMLQKGDFPRHWAGTASINELSIGLDPGGARNRVFAKDAVVLPDTGSKFRNCRAPAP